MKIFILEDDKHRMIKFRRELIGHQIDHATTVKDGTSLVLKNKYDLIFLDHDLGGEEFVDSFAGNTGYELAKLIASSTPNKETPCIVHSCNSVGAYNILRVLPYAVKLPFILLDIASAVEWAKKCYFKLY